VRESGMVTVLKWRHAERHARDVSDTSFLSRDVLQRLRYDVQEHQDERSDKPPAREASDQAFSECLKEFAH